VREHRRSHAPDNVWPFKRKRILDKNCIARLRTLRTDATENLTAKASAGAGE
jgi:hypothetical protein